MAQRQPQRRVAVELAAGRERLHHAALGIDANDGTQLALQRDFIRAEVGGLGAGGTSYFVGHRVDAAVSAEERRVGKGWVSTCRSRWTTGPSKKKQKKSET